MSIDIESEVLAMWTLPQDAYLPGQPSRDDSDRPDSTHYLEPKYPNGGKAAAAAWIESGQVLEKAELSKSKAESVGSMPIVALIMVIIGFIVASMPGPYIDKIGWLLIVVAFVLILWSICDLDNSRRVAIEIAQPRIDEATAIRGKQADRTTADPLYREGSHYGPLPY